MAAQAASNTTANIIQPPPQSPKPPAATEDIPSDTKTSSTVSEPTQITDDREDSKRATGECISYDNVGLTSPESIDGYRQFIAFLDTRSKYLYCYPVKTCNEEIFLYHLNRVVRFFTTRGFRPCILRSDYYTTFRSAKANQFYVDNQCKHESSAPYQQWQNAVERDIQTILSNVSATIHGQDFMRADTWAHALKQWTRLHNAFPHAVLQDTPARLIDPAYHQYRFAFGDLLCFPLQEHERLWKST